MVLFKHEVYKADPLGPNNILGVMSGLLTNTGAFFSGRWEVVGNHEDGTHAEGSFRSVSARR